tara:strand:+ start:156 stop:305 length:150 start_codon:yes stop_codon:yes gene_type:complete
LEEAINSNLQSIDITTEARVMTKDKAYDIAGKIVEAYKDIKGVARDNYL